MVILLFFYAILPGAQLAVLLGSQEILDPTATLNFGASVLCLHWMLAQTILAAKIPLLQRLLPYDRRIRFHVWASVGIVVTLVIHGVSKVIAGKEIDPVSWALLGVFTLMLAFALVWVPVFGRILTRQALSYDRSKSVHGWFQQALTALLFVHIAGSGFFDDIPGPSVALYGMLFAGATAGFLLSKAGVFHQGATVVAAEHSGGIVTVSLAPDRRVRYRGGQFAFLRHRGPSGGKEDHPFSFLSHPGENLVKFAIRTKGDFTRNLVGLQAGDRVRINGGYGNFRPGKDQGLCFVATGVGAVPFLSILKELKAAGDLRPVHFHWSVATEEEVPDRGGLEVLAAGMPNLTLKIQVKPTGAQRFSPEYFRREIEDLKAFTYFVCTSPGVRAEIVRSLRSVGVPKSSVRWEAFTLG